MTLKRNQIAAFVGNDPQAIRAMEQLFQVADETIPRDIAELTSRVSDAEVNEAAIEAGQAALAAIVKALADRVAGHDVAPVAAPNASPQDDVSPAGVTGATGVFTAQSGETVTVVGGIVTSIT